VAGLPGQQGQQRPLPVAFAEARTHTLSAAVRLPGSVETFRKSQVAAATGGLVIKLPVRDGETVPQGAVLAELDRRSLELRLEAVEAQRKEAEARWNAAKRSADRAREMFASQLVSQQQLDDVLFEFNAWEARLENLRAEIASIQVDLERSTIRAPFAGVIVRKHTEVGQWLRVGDPVAELMSLAELEVVVNVPEAYYANLKPGYPARVRFDALGGREVTGRISVIIPQADIEGRTFPVKVAIPDQKGAVGAGMTAEVVLGSQESRRATLVPKDAVVIDGSRRVVYVIDGEQKVAPREVLLGAGLGSWIEISGPVRAGDRVVTRGNERLRPGLTVQGTAMEYEAP
jgi:RND family efflux transporter MFP subunit